MHIEDELFRKMANWGWYPKALFQDGRIRIWRRHRIGIEDSSRMGGLCRVQEKHFLIMHSRLTVKEKIGNIVKTLKGFEIGESTLGR